MAVRKKMKKRSSSGNPVKLGLSDKELARRYECPPAIITKIRGQHGRRNHPRQRSLLARLPDRVVRKLLGRETDDKTAERLGVSRRTVIRHRESLGIPAFFSSYKHELPSRLTSKKMLSILGSDVDRVVAEKLGVSRRTVIRYRQALDIGPPGSDGYNSKHALRAGSARKPRSASSRGNFHPRRSARRA